MPKDVQYGRTIRKSFARAEEIQDMPHLLEIQKNSYKWFLDEGLREVFKGVAAITDYSGNLELSFVDYSMNEPPKYTEEECKARDATYAAPLKVSVRLRNRETEEIKEQEIFMGDFPLMTASGTFIQRRRACYRLPDRPFPRYLLRQENGQDQQLCLRHDHHPVPRRVA